MRQTDEQSLQIVAAGLLDLGSFHVDEVQRDLLLGLQLAQIEAERERALAVSSASFSSGTS